MSKHHALPQLGEVGKNFFSHANDPRNTGSLAAPDGTGKAVGQCGDSITVDLQVDGNVIRDIKVAPQGCLYTKACASAVSELAKGKNLTAALQIEPEDVERVLGGLPEDHLHCARLAVNTLGEAIADALGRQVNNGTGKF
jgi:nitrogen fixation NifU-like protein